jgi:SAM-dependent methyltransferase
MENIEEIKKYLLENEKSEYFLGHIDRISESFLFIKKYLHEINTSSGSVVDVGGEDAIKHLQKFYKNISFSNTNFDLRYPFDMKSNSCNMALCMEVLEHIKDRDSNDLSHISAFRGDGVLNMLCEINRILVDNGFLFLTTPNVNNYLSVEKILVYGTPMFYLPHVKEYSYIEMRDLLEVTGFGVLEWDTKNVWPDGSDGERHKDFIEKIKKFTKENGFQDEHRGDDFFILARKIKEPDQILKKSEYFTITYKDLFKKRWGFKIKRFFNFFK